MATELEALKAHNVMLREALEKAAKETVCSTGFCYGCACGEPHKKIST